MIEQKNCTIIIPHLGKTKEQEYAFQECMRSLDETVPNMKKIVAINGGLKIPGADYNNTKFILMTEQGQCRAVNAAVQLTNTPWIFITNDDMIYAPGWEKELFIIDGTYKCVSPKLIEPRPGAPTFEVYFCGGAGGDFDKQKFLDYVKNHRVGRWQDSHRSGFNLPFLINRELWDTIGGYDINYDPWGSNGDSDLEYKIKLAGVQPMQAQYSWVYHFSQTSATFHPDNRPYWENNWKYFIDKWGFERASSPTIWTADFEIPMDKLKYKPDWINKYAEKI